MTPKRKPFFKPSKRKKVNYYIDFEGVIEKINSQKIHSIQIPTSFLRCLQNGGKALTVFASRYKVPDVWRYKINISSNNKVTKHFLCQSLKNSVYPDREIYQETFLYTKRIVLLLESPHKDEFNFKNNILTPKAPAQGITGGNINLFITDVIEHINLPSGVYDLLIVNPIPYMTSLGVFYDSAMKTELKEEIWNTLWDIKTTQANFLIRDDFLTRCNSYAPSIILNFCTGSGHGLQKKVTNFLKLSFNPSIPIWTAYHPVKWDTKKWNHNKFNLKIV